MLTLDSKTPSDCTCLREPLGGFCDVGCDFVVVLHFIFDLHFVVVLHFVSRLLYHVTGTPSRLLMPVKAFNSSELYPDYFWLPFLFHLQQALRFWVGIFWPQAFFTLRSFPTFLAQPQALRFWVSIFYPQAFFTLRSFPTFLAQPAFIKAFLGASSSALKFAGLHTDPQNTDPAHLFVWFTVIHNPLYILNLHLYMSILQQFYLQWKLW